jgi:ADP-ribose pyrophosphatase
VKDRESVKKKRVIADGKYLRLIDRDGWEYVERIGAPRIVAMVATTGDSRLVLVEQYRPALDTRIIELPSGLVGDRAEDADEDMESAARRELLEETGYEAEKLTYLTRGSVSSGLSAEVVAFYRCASVRKVASGGGDDSEDIITHAPPLEGIEDWLHAKEADGLMIDTKVWAGLFFARTTMPQGG